MSFSSMHNDYLDPDRWLWDPEGEEDEEEEMNRRFHDYKGDGDSWGTFDFYEDFRTLLEEALAANCDFDTGWKGVKKAIESFRIVREGDKAVCSVSCSDDFDTEGFGQVEIALQDKERIGAIQEALTQASGRAYEDRKANKAYQMFAVGPTNELEKIASWELTLILPKGEGVAMDNPPGDSYYWWGWDDLNPDNPEDCEATPGFPDEVRNELEKWAWDFTYGSADGNEHTHMGWVIRPIVD